MDPIIEEIVPAPDPWEAVAQLSNRQGLVLFDSAGGPEKLSRYSFLMAEPFAVLRCDSTFDGSPFDSLRTLVGSFQVPPVPELPPFQTGVVALLSYELVHRLERLPRPKVDEFQLPELIAAAYDWCLSWDHHQRRCWLVATGLSAGGGLPSRDEAGRRIGVIRQALSAAARFPHRPDVGDATITSPFTASELDGHSGVFSNFDRRGFESAIRRGIEYTHAGDCFQVNLAQRLITRSRSSAFDLYARLRTRNPAPFAAFADFGDWQLVSASPERFLQMRSDGVVETRPIKGTRPRGNSLQADRALIAELMSSPKDRAENVMIVDLLRNDLGRVCEFRSIEVPSLCRLESYPTVHHLVSEVRGRIRSGLDAVDLLKAAFPGGSVTGAPKVRSMQIISELEPTARGAYCGCLAWLGFDGAMDASILIRTITAGKGWWQFPVGGGIVADSDPVREFDETLHKAAGLLRALD